MMFSRFKKKSWLNQSNTLKSKGFTLTELLISISIVGILSSISLPIYTRQIAKTRQSEAAGILTYLQTSIANYLDEYGAHPTEWGNLARISVVMTNNGPIQINDAAKLSESKAMHNENYEMVIDVDSTNNDHYILTATPTDNSSYNVKACIDISNGASDLKIGMKASNTAVADCSLTCIGPSTC